MAIAKCLCNKYAIQHLLTNLIINIVVFDDVCTYNHFKLIENTLERNSVLKVWKAYWILIYKKLRYIGTYKWFFNELCLVAYNL